MPALTSDSDRREPSTGLYHQAGYVAIEWLVATSRTLHAYEPGARRSICNVADRPTRDASPSGRTCATCRGLLGDPEPPDAEPWADVWERARRRPRLREAMDRALDRLADAMETGIASSIEVASMQVEQVAAAITRKVGP